MARTTLGRPAKGLPRFFMDCGWHRHPRYAGLPAEGLVTFQAIISYATEHATDGHAPADFEDLAIAIGVRPSWVKKALPQLLNRGALERHGDEVMVPGWADHNPTAAEIDAYTDERSAAGTRGNHRRWHQGDRWNPDCKFCQEEGRPDSLSDRSSDSTDTESATNKHGSDADSARNSSDSDTDSDTERDPSTGPVDNRNPKRDKGSSPPDDRYSDRSSDPTAIANPSHGMGWDGTTEVVGTGSSSCTAVAPLRDDDDPPAPATIADDACRIVAQRSYTAALAAGQVQAVTDHGRRKYLDTCVSNALAEHADRALELALADPDATPEQIAALITPPPPERTDEPAAPATAVDATQAAMRALMDRNHARAEGRACPRCKGSNMVEVADGFVPCDHAPEAVAS